MAVKYKIEICLITSDIIEKKEDENKYLSND